jgi:maleate cis-trans isomerase
VTSAYAPKGLVGLLTPQANTTVEPECALLWPPGVAMLTARMTSARSTIEERLVDYAESLEQTLAQFGGAPLDAVACGVTGASYLMGPAAEDRRFGELSERLGIPVTNAALALVAALRALSARRIGLVSPYPQGLTDLSVRYWQSRGFDVAALTQVGEGAGPGHPVYRLGMDAAADGLPALATAGADAIVLLGTGMPTLPTIARHPAVGEAPVLSSTLTLAWHCVEGLQGHGLSPRVETLCAWIGGEGWRERLPG